MLEAIFFDLDGTIRQNDPRGSEVFADHAARLGLRLREDDRMRAMRWEHFYWANSSDLRADRERFDGDETGYWTHYSHRQLVALGASNQQAADLSAPMNAYMMNSFKPGSVVPPEIPQVLRLLQAAGLKLGVISNRSQPYVEELAALGLDRFFAYSLAAGEIDLWKPEPGIFLHACQRVGVRPELAAYVGDNYFADVVGARRAQLTPVLYDPRGIFDDPECAVIRSFSELPQAVGLDLVPERTGTTGRPEVNAQRGPSTS